MSIDPASLRWRRSSESTGVGEVVEVAELPDGGWAMRNGDGGEQGPVLWFTKGEWAAFVAGVKDGEFDF